MELFILLYHHYRSEALKLLKKRGIVNPSSEEIEALIIKCCIFEVI